MMNVRKHAIERYRERIDPMAGQNNGAVRERIKSEIDNGQIATRGVLRKIYTLKKINASTDLLVYSEESRAIFVCTEPETGGIVVRTVLKCGSKKRHSAGKYAKVRR